MKKLALFAYSVLLAGCVSSGDVRDRVPIADNAITGYGSLLDAISAVTTQSTLGAGQLLLVNSAGVTLVATGTDGQVLTSQGAGLPFQFEAAAGGGGSGLGSQAWDATGVIAPIGTTTYSLVDTIGATNGHHLAVFDPDDTESGLVRGVCPTGYDGGTITVYAWCTSDTADGVIAGACKWQNLSQQDLTADSYGSYQNDTVTPSAADTTNDDPLTFSFSSADADNLAAGDPFSMIFVRQAERATDTDTGIMGLLRLVIAW